MFTAFCPTLKWPKQSLMLYLNNSAVANVGSGSANMTFQHNSEFTFKDIFDKCLYFK